MRKLLNFTRDDPYTTSFLIFTVLFSTIGITELFNKYRPEDLGFKLMFFVIVIVLMSYFWGYYMAKRQSILTKINGDITLDKKFGDWLDLNQIFKWAVEKRKDGTWQITYWIEVTSKTEEHDINALTVDQINIMVGSDFFENDILPGSTEYGNGGTKSFTLDDLGYQGKILTFTGNLRKYTVVCKRPPVPGKICIKMKDDKIFNGFTMIPS